MQPDPDSPLNNNQRRWLELIQQAESSELSLGDFAKANELNLQHLYHFRYALRKKGLLPAIDKKPLFEKISIKQAQVNLPDDIDALKQLVLELVQENSQQAGKIQSQNHQIHLLQEQLNLAIQKRFAAHSEKHSPDQLGLFNEAKEIAQTALTEETPDDDAESVEISPHQRKKPGRKPLSNVLPRVEVIHDLDEADKVCPHDGHALKHIGDTVSEQLDIIPAKIQVLRHVRRKYACPCCQQGVKTAALPPQPIPKSQASPGLLA